MNRYLRIHVHSSIIDSSQKMDITQMSISGRLKNKIYHIHTMKYYLALERKEIQINAKAWMNLEGIMLSEINQTQKDKYLYDSTYEVLE